MPLEPRDPTVRVPSGPGRQGRHDNSAHQSARPATEDLRQGEGRTVLALLGTVRPRGQTGDTPHGVRGSEGEQRRPGIDGVTFAAIEASGVEGFLQQLRDELVSRTDSAPAVSAERDPKGGQPQGRVLSPGKDLIRFLWRTEYETR